jgi:hypothetical protein
MAVGAIRSNIGSADHMDVKINFAVAVQTFQVPDFLALI